MKHTKGDIRPIQECFICFVNFDISPDNTAPSPTWQLRNNERRPRYDEGHNFLLYIYIILGLIFFQMSDPIESHFLLRSTPTKIRISTPPPPTLVAHNNLVSTDAWTWVMSWLDTIPHQAMVTLLQKHFFPKWLQVLCSWLSAIPNYNEVTKWYTGWKSMFPESLASDPLIKGRLKLSRN